MAISWHLYVKYLSNICYTLNRIELQSLDSGLAFFFLFLSRKRFFIFYFIRMPCSDKWVKFSQVTRVVHATERRDVINLNFNQSNFLPMQQMQKEKRFFSIRNYPLGLAKPNGEKKKKTPKAFIT